MQKEKDILARAVSTGVFTNSAIFLFCVSLDFAVFAEHNKNRGFSPKRNKGKHNNITNVMC